MTAYLNEVLDEARRELVKARIPEDRIARWRARVHEGRIVYPLDLPSKGWKRAAGRSQLTTDDFFRKPDPVEFLAKLYSVAVAYLDAKRDHSADLEILAREFGALNERFVSSGWRKVIDRRRSSGGGRASTLGKKQRAKKWQDKIQLRVERMLKAGNKTDTTIAVNLAPETAFEDNPARGVSTVRAFVAGIRRRLNKK